MPTLYEWTIVRAGNGMTIKHSVGKLTGVVRVEPREINGAWFVVAVCDDAVSEFSLGVGSAR